MIITVNMGNKSVWLVQRLKYLFTITIKLHIAAGVHTDSYYFTSIIFFAKKNWPSDEQVSGLMTMMMNRLLVFTTRNFYKCIFFNKTRTSRYVTALHCNMYPLIMPSQMTVLVQQPKDKLKMTKEKGRKGRNSMAIFWLLYIITISNIVSDCVCSVHFVYDTCKFASIVWRGDEITYLGAHTPKTFWGRVYLLTMQSS